MSPATRPRPADGAPPQHPPLRRWQTECLARALEWLSPQTPHFLCQATPGAGKMLFAAVLAEALIAQGDIDYVIYVGPTRAVVADARDSLSHVLDSAMDGQLGAIGMALTYHALPNRLAALIRLCRQWRILLIWDESHHAAAPGGMISAPNQWGMTLMALERHVRYTLALSGTPWRTDGSCLPLLRYVDAQSQTDDETTDADETVVPSNVSSQQLMPDYVYTLKQAILDGVCRYPHIALVDNRAIGLTHKHPITGRKEARQYTSIAQLLRHPAVQYAQVVREQAPQGHMLTLSMERLNGLRQDDLNAGGLVVASSIAHAEDIAQQLEASGQTVCLVTSQEPNAHAKLEAFRDAKTPWIVSVGMVSEGVNLPRLRVCCYLSHIRTEQFFRQVLGRIIRCQGDEDATCYFYALNETRLRRFARRLTDDLPNDLAKVTLPGNTARATDAQDVTTIAGAMAAGGVEGDTGVDPLTATAVAGEDTATTSPNVSISFRETTSNQAVAMGADVAFSQAFFERLVALRLTD